MAGINRFTVSGFLNRIRRLPYELGVKTKAGKAIGKPQAQSDPYGKGRFIL